MSLRLGGQIGPSVGELVDTLADADEGTGLPEALIHPDLTPPNAVPRGDQPPVIIDWIGVGRGPRVWPLAFLLFAAGPRGARRGLDRYTRSISLSEEELHRLPGMLITRPLALDLWSVAHQRMTVQRSITRCHAHRARAEAVAAALHDPAFCEAAGLDPRTVRRLHTSTWATTSTSHPRPSPPLASRPWRAIPDG